MKNETLTEKFKSFKSIIELVNEYSDEQKCIKALEKVRWGDKVVSPYDSTSKVYPCKDGWYKCKNTQKEFNV